METVTHELMMVENLGRAAKWHKDNCRTNDCGVSLFQLKQTAQFIQKFMMIMSYADRERRRVEEIINEMPSI